MSLKSPTGRLARWALSLQSYNIHIDYTPGKTNVVADTLSSQSCRADRHSDNCMACTVQVDMPSTGAAATRNGQMEDQDLKKIIETLESDKLHEEAKRYSDQGYLISNGVLFWYIQDEDNELAQLVIPKAERETIIRTYHNDAAAGHSTIFWPGMRKVITAYVKKCTECQKYQASNLKPAGVIQSVASRERFEIIAIDLFGPLPETR